MDYVTDVAIAFARAQHEAGADLMGVGDAPSSLVGRSIFEQFILPYHLKLVAALREMGLKTRSHICGNTTKICESRAKIGYDILDFDSQVSLDFVRGKLGPDPIILGNIPTVEVMEKGSPSQVQKAASECLRTCGANHIISAGCEVPRTTPNENMEALRNYACSLAMS
jgi:MtaA/CmuA family methyltransferase